MWFTRWVGGGRRSSPVARIATLMLAAGFTGAPMAGAAEIFWTGAGATNNWSDGANWSPPGPPPNPVSPGDQVTFSAPGSTSTTSNVDVPWTVSALLFNDHIPPRIGAEVAFTLTGSSITLTRSIEIMSRSVSLVNNDLVLAGVDAGRGLQVDFRGAAQGHRPLVLSGAVTGPARIHVAGGALDFTRYVLNRAPQNAGSPIGGEDPGVGFGLFNEGPGKFARITFSPPGSGTHTFFGEAATAIGLKGGTFEAYSSSPDAVNTITNAVRILDAGADQSLLSVDRPGLYVGGTFHRQQTAFTGPMTLKGNLALYNANALNQGRDGYVLEYRGAITVAGDSAAIAPALNGGDALISGDIGQDGVPRTLHLGRIAANPNRPGEENIRRLVLGGDNRGLTGGIRIVGDPYYDQTPRNKDILVRFMSLESMGGGGNGNVFIGPGTVAGIGFPLSAAALEKIDRSSTGALAIDADSDLDVDFSPAGLNLNVSVGVTAGDVMNPIRYTGRITPYADAYRFGGGGGVLRLDNADSFTGPRSLEVVAAGQIGGTLILGAANSYTGPTVVRDSRLVGAVPGAVNPASPIQLDSGGEIQFGLSGTTAPQTHAAPIELGTLAGGMRIFAAPSSGTDYDLRLSGNLTGGSPSNTLFFDGGGRILLTGSKNDHNSKTVVWPGGTTLIVDGQLAPAPGGGDATLTVGFRSRLGGGGTIRRPVELEQTAIVSPGHGIGTLTIDSDLKLPGNQPPNQAIYEFEFNATDSDMLLVGGDVEDPAVTNALLKLIARENPGRQGQTLPFLRIGGELENPINWLVDASGAPGYQGSFVTFDSGTKTYFVTLQAPEPGAAACLAAGLSVLSLRRRGHLKART